MYREELLLWRQVRIVQYIGRLFIQRRGSNARDHQKLGRRKKFQGGCDWVLLKCIQSHEHDGVYNDDDHHHHRWVVVVHFRVNCCITDRIFFYYCHTLLLSCMIHNNAAVYNSKHYYYYTLLWWYHQGSTNCASPSLHNLMSYYYIHSLSLIYNYLSCSDHSGANSQTQKSNEKKNTKALCMICPTWVMMREKREKREKWTEVNWSSFACVKIQKTRDVGAPFWVPN